LSPIAEEESLAPFDPAAHFHARLRRDRLRLFSRTLDVALARESPLQPLEGLQPGSSP